MKQDAKPAARPAPKATPKPRAKSNVSNAERAYRALKALIMNNELRAGTQLLELEAAVQFGMSRTPVREAMIRLEQEGVVEIKPRHGMRVLPISASDMREIFEVIAALESTAAEKVARRGLSEAELAALRATVADMKAALEREDLHGWSDADERFHILLIGYAANKRLAGVVEQFWDQSHRSRVVTLRLQPSPIISTYEHAALVEAIAQRDPVSAARIHRAHRDRVDAIHIEVFERLDLEL